MNRLAPALALLLFGVSLAAGCGDSGENAAPGDAGPPEASRDAGLSSPLCVDGKSVDGEYPKRTYGFLLNDTIPDLAFDTLDDNGQPAKIHMHDYFEPCAEQSRLLVFRVGAAWCGTCRWHLAHTAELHALDVAPRVRLVDLLVANEDNVPATLEDLAAYKARIDAPAQIAIDPEFRLGAVLEYPGALPLFVFVDTRTMRIINYLNDPYPDWLAYRLRAAFSLLDRTPAPQPPQSELTDGFHRNQWDMIQEMKLPGAPPPDPTNAKADDPKAAAFGQALFFDNELSPNGTVSCATCHDPAKSFADGLPQGVGVATGDRNTPSILLAAHSRWQFWDGRADTLWAQALGPFENEKEFASSRLWVAHAVHHHHREAYEEVFGPMPDLTDFSRFPAEGKPGDPSWEGMAPADREIINRIFSNVGKAIAAFERTFRVKESALDRYVAGDRNALNEEQKLGFHIFFTAGCAQCHYGPRLTDDAFHIVRFPTGRQDGLPDRGRTDGIPLLLASEFNASGPFSDDPSAAHGLLNLKPGPWTLGAFRTPTLRGIAETGPFGHGGTEKTLLDVSKLYGKAGLEPEDPRAVGTVEPWLPLFVEEHQVELVHFLEVLTAAADAPVGDGGH